MLKEQKLSLIVFAAVFIFVIAIFFGLTLGARMAEKDNFRAGNYLKSKTSDIMS